MKKTILSVVCLLLLSLLVACNASVSFSAESTHSTASDESQVTTKMTTSEEDPATTTMTSESEGQHDYTLGTWWWGTNYIKNEIDLKLRLDFLQDNGVTEIYVYYGRIFDKYFRSFVADCDSRGIRVAALGGDANWLTEDGFAAYQRWLSKIKDYQAEAEDDEKFYGVHIDLEPHQIPQYAADPAAMSAEVARVYDTGRQFCDENKLLFEADVSMWIDDPDLMMPDNNEQVTLGEYITRRVDTLSIMSYRDTAAAQFNDAQPMIDLAVKYGRKVLLGSETGESTEADFVTYYEEGKAKMMEQQQMLKAMMDEKYSNYGLAIHYVDSWFLLKD